MCAPNFASSTPKLGRASFVPLQSTTQAQRWCFLGSSFGGWFKENPNGQPTHFRDSILNVPKCVSKPGGTRTGCFPFDFSKSLPKFPTQKKGSTHTTKPRPPARRSARPPGAPRQWRQPLLPPATALQQHLVFEDPSCFLAGTRTPAKKKSFWPG